MIGLLVGITCIVIGLLLIYLAPRTDEEGRSYHPSEIERPFYNLTNKLVSSEAYIQSLRIGGALIIVFGLVVIVLALQAPRPATPPRSAATPTPSARP
jgi:hypothetical protein